MPTAADCLAALRFEIDWRRDRGLATPADAVALVLADIRDAAGCGDQGRLTALWQGLHCLLDEAVAFHRERGCLPV